MYLFLLFGFPANQRRPRQGVQGPDVAARGGHPAQVAGAGRRLAIHLQQRRRQRQVFFGFEKENNSQRRNLPAEETGLYLSGELLTIPDRVVI